MNVYVAILVTAGLFLFCGIQLAMLALRYSSGGEHSPSTSPFLKMSEFRSAERAPLSERPLRFHTILTVDESDIMQWQARIMAYSFRKVGQEGTLTRTYGSKTKAMSMLDLVSSPTHELSSRAREKGLVWVPNRDEVPSMITADYAKMEDPPYPALNKPYHLWEWLQRTSYDTKHYDDADNVIILDPDMHYLRKFSKSEAVRPGNLLAHYWPSMRPAGLAQTIDRYCLDPSGYQPVGPPYVVTRGDLKRWLPVWIAKTTQMGARADPDVECSKGCWVREMIAAAIAASEIGLNITVENLAVQPPHNHIGKATFVSHWAHKVVKKNDTHRWEWDKKNWNKRQRESDDDDEEGGRRRNRKNNDLLDIANPKRLLKMKDEGWPMATKLEPVPDPPIGSKIDDGTTNLVAMLNEALQEVPGLRIPSARLSLLTYSRDMMGGDDEDDEGDDMPEEGDRQQRYSEPRQTPSDDRGQSIRLTSDEGKIGGGLDLKFGESRDEIPRSPKKQGWRVGAVKH